MEIFVNARLIAAAITKATENPTDHWQDPSDYDECDEPEEHDERPTDKEAHES